MKRIGNLYERIYDYDNLALAYWKAKKGKIKKREVINFDFSREVHKIQEEFKSETVDIGNYHYFTIYDPKERMICAASFKERIIHHAIMNVCGGLFDKGLIFNSYACRKGKGQHRAVDKAQEYANKKAFYLKMDIRKYFNSINHKILKELISRKIKDKKLLNLFDKIIDSYCVVENKGIPIGNLTSQYFANLYLSELDYFVKEDLKCKYFVRYMDDFMIFSNDKSYLNKMRIKCIKYLSEDLDLELKKGGYINKVFLGFDFLGYRLFKYKRLLNKRSKQRFCNKFKEYEKKFINEEYLEEELQQRVQSIFNFALFANSNKLREKMINESLLKDY